MAQMLLLRVAEALSATERLKLLREMGWGTSPSVAEALSATERLKPIQREDLLPLSDGGRGIERDRAIETML